MIRHFSLPTDFLSALNQLLLLVEFALVLPRVSLDDVMKFLDIATQSAFSFLQLFSFARVKSTSGSSFPTLSSALTSSSRSCLCSSNCANCASRSSFSFSTRDSSVSNKRNSLLMSSTMQSFESSSLLMKNLYFPVAGTSKKPVTTAPSLAPNAMSDPVPDALHPAQPAALVASAEPQFPAQPEALAAPAAPQFPAQPQPQVAPTAGPDFGALPDYIAEAQEYLGDAASYAAMGGDNGGGDDDDDINDVDFGQAGAQQGLAQAPEAGADLAEMALVQRDQDASAAAAKALPVRWETSEVPGRRRLNQDDFLDLVALEDPWFQLLLQVFPDRGPVFATLTGVQRLIDPSNPNHWRLGIDRKVDLSFVDPDFWNNMQQRFEQHLHTKLQIEVELLDMMPHGAPVQLALIKEHEAQVHAKADVQKIKPLNNLLKIMGENWDRVGIELYHSGKLPLSPHH